MISTSLYFQGPFTSLFLGIGFTVVVVVVVVSVIFAASIVFVVVFIAVVVVFPFLVVSNDVVVVEVLIAIFGLLVTLSLDVQLTLRLLRSCLYQVCDQHHVYNYNYFCLIMVTNCSSMNFTKVSDISGLVARPHLIM